MKVERNTGCPYCDEGLVPTKMKRQMVHYNRRTGKIVVCRRGQSGDAVHASTPPTPSLSPQLAVAE